MEKREIKFRAISPVNTDEPKTMQYYNLEKIADLNRFVNDDWAVDQIMQYTGLKDKDGNEIWEGDILELQIGEINNKYRYKVLFEDGSFVGYHTKLKDGFGKPQRWGLISQFNFKDLQVVVVGNVFENPNLCDGKI